MDKSIGIRLDKDFLRKVAELERKEALDRSTIIRKLAYMGYKELVKEEAIQNYLKGKITLSEAAHKTGVTIWEMEKILIERGYKSSYSVEDLDQELKLLND
jgi:predicted HTH domain antitoxin